MGRARIEVTQLLVVLSVLLNASCGTGFKVIQPPAGTEILSIRNQAVAAPKSIDYGKYLPQPLPILPAGKGPPAASQVPLPDESLAAIPPWSKSRDARLATIGVPEEADLSIYPFNATAKMFFYEGPQGYSCSAQFVGQSNVILTAAHCVYTTSTQTWNTDFIFDKGYRDGAYQQAFGWKCAAIFSGWPIGQYSKDYAFVETDTSADHAMGMAFSPPPAFESMGYPANYNNAQRLMHVAGNLGNVGDEMQMLNNPMGHGSSGGAWNDGISALSVNSFKYDNDPNSMYGPIFNANTRRLYDFVSNDCSETIPPNGTGFDPSQLEPHEAVVEIRSFHATGPRIQQVRDTSCECGQVSYELFDPTGVDHAVDVSIGDPSTNGLKTFFSPSNHQHIGCAAEKQATVGCVARPVPRIVSVARAIPPELSKGRALDASFCSQHCLNSPGDGWCATLGADAKPIAAALAGFIAKDLGGSQPNGVVATKKQMVARFGGDPEKIDDPCQRGPFVKEAGRISNTGLDCRVTTPELKEQGAIRISLSTPSRTSARPSSSTVLSEFDERDSAPNIQFSGDNGDVLNKRYGGLLKSVEERSNTLIGTTENGCIASSEQ